MKKLGLLLVLIPILLGSCHDKTQKKIEEFNDKASLILTISNSNKILFRAKKENQTETTRSDSSFDIAMYKAEKQQIEGFRKLFENSIYTEYCCCPKTNLSINFYKDSEEIETYFVDTTAFKNKVRIFEQSFQYSFLIDKEQWKNYLKEINNE